MNNNNDFTITIYLFKFRVNIYFKETNKKNYKKIKKKIFLNLNN